MILYTLQLQPSLVLPGKGVEGVRHLSSWLAYSLRLLLLLMTTFYYKFSCLGVQWVFLLGSLRPMASAKAY